MFNVYCIPLLTMFSQSTKPVFKHVFQYTHNVCCDLIKFTEVKQVARIVHAVVRYYVIDRPMNGRERRYQNVSMCHVDISFAHRQRDAVCLQVCKLLGQIVAWLRVRAHLTQQMD